MKWQTCWKLRTNCTIDISITEQFRPDERERGIRRLTVKWQSSDSPTWCSGERLHISCISGLSYHISVCTGSRSMTTSSVGFLGDNRDNSLFNYSVSFWFINSVWFEGWRNLLWKMRRFSVVIQRLHSHCRKTINQPNFNLN